MDSERAGLGVRRRARIGSTKPETDSACVAEARCVEGDSAAERSNQGRMGWQRGSHDRGASPVSQRPSSERCAIWWSCSAVSPTNESPQPTMRLSIQQRQLHQGDRPGPKQSRHVLDERLGDDSAYSQGQPDPRPPRGIRAASIVRAQGLVGKLPARIVHGSWHDGGFLTFCFVQGSHPPGNRR